MIGSVENFGLELTVYFVYISWFIVFACSFLFVLMFLHFVLIFAKKLLCITAGEIRLLPSAKLIGEVKRTGQRDPISISDVLDVLRLQLTVAECDLSLIHI